ncbi:extracellular solute-binding protein [Neobacillus notoginsengisoli]|uniref:Extracellular solute-binding protein n=1 Tax=Neobacillus notoginsengisoli TaxID=1578198 RepID=A0A417YYM1_9BACI|nr:ABC transporter substrate-binding protein [Neobacillus notoginsengisoli]RHW42862.1 extracellular solute-binding protein [Neobacillus notoginsengisoli]
MKKKRLSLLLVLLLSVFTVLSACSSSSDKKPASNAAENKGKQDSKPQGKLTVYVGFQEDHAIEAMRQFTKDTGIEAEMVRMSGGEILAKVLAEKDNPQADIWYGGPSDTFNAAKKDDLLEAYVSQEAAKIDERYKDPEGYWTGIYMGALGFAYNKDFIKKHNIDPPKSWEDLLDPIYKGQVVMGNPSSSSTAYTVMYTILKVMGSEEKGFEYLKKLHAQIQQYPTSGTATGRMVGMGEAAAGLIFAHDIVKYQEEGFESLGIAFPEEGTGYETGAVGIIKNNKNPELAKKFVDWALSKNAQEVGQRTGSYQSLTNPDAKQPEKAIDFSQLNLIDYDSEEAGRERQRLIEKWNKEVK